MLDEEAAQIIHKALGLAPFFPDASPATVGKLFPESAAFPFPKGARILEQGDSGRDIFVILSGGVSIVSTAGAALARLGPGEVFGEMALFKEGTRTANAVAAEDSMVFRVFYSDVHLLFKFNPELTDHLKRLAASRLSAG